VTAQAHVALSRANLETPHKICSSIGTKFYLSLGYIVAQKDEAYKRPRGKNPYCHG
jgi:hypothetical protein